MDLRFSAASSMQFTRRRALQLLGGAAAAPALAAAAQTPPQSAQQLPAVPRASRPKHEVRAIWIHPEQHTDADETKGRAQIRETVQRFAKANFNTLLPWTVSGYLEALDTPSYREKHPTAAWNSLGVLLEEAKREGLDVDLWYSFTDYRDASSPEFNPAVGGSKEWAAKRIDEIDPKQTLVPMKYKRVDNVCPQHYPARAWMLGQLKHTLDRYPTLHGLHIEEPGYGTEGYCLCDLCTTTYEQLYGKKLFDDIKSPQAEDFRTLGCSAFMESLRAKLQANYPKVVFSANGGHDWRHDRVRGRDWGRWAQSGWLNYYVPQVYEPDLAKFRSQLALTISDIGMSCPVYAGMARDSTTGKSDVSQLIQQITAARDLGAPGLCLFHGAAFTDADLEALRKGPFAKPA